jgi:hypothetical protein
LAVAWRGWWPLVVVVIAAALLAAGYVGNLLNEHRGDPQLLTGEVLVSTTNVHGDHIAIIRVNGVHSYSIENSVPWTDNNNSLHEGSWPACLGNRLIAHVPIRFTAITTKLPNGEGDPIVLWVDCRGY